MPLFNQDAEKLRKDNLKNFEDKRMQFAEKLEKMGFAPERMLFCSSENGSFTAIAHFNGQFAVIVSPIFGQEGDFTIDIQDEFQIRREDVFEKGTGLNGAFGFGVKGARGFRLYFTLSDGSEAVLPVVAGRTSWMETTRKKNPLLSTKRRRGNSNLVWDMMPVDPGRLSKVEDILAKHYIP